VDGLLLVEVELLLVVVVVVGVGVFFTGAAVVVVLAGFASVESEELEAGESGLTLTYFFAGRLFFLVVLVGA